MAARGLEHLGRIDLGVGGQIGGQPGGTVLTGVHDGHREPHTRMRAQHMVDFA